MTALRIVRSVLLTAAAALGALCIVLYLLGVAFGVKPEVVVSGSMEPTLPVGSLILVQETPADALHTGDIVTVPRTDGHGLVTHRVVGAEQVDGADGAVRLVLRGDANDSDDPSPYLVREAGRQLVTVPWLGYVALGLRTPAGIAGVIVVVAALLVATLLPARGSASRPRS